MWQDTISHINVVASPYGKSCVVVGGSYRGSTGVLLKGTECRYKIQLSGGREVREVYLKNGNLKVQWDDPGDVAKELLKFQYHFDCLMAFLKQLDVTHLA